MEEILIIFSIAIELLSGFAYRCFLACDWKSGRSNLGGGWMAGWLAEDKSVIHYGMATGKWQQRFLLLPGNNNNKPRGQETQRFIWTIDWSDWSSNRSPPLDNREFTRLPFPEMN